MKIGQKWAQNGVSSSQTPIQVQVQVGPFTVHIVESYNSYREADAERERSNFADLRA